MAKKNYIYGVAVGPRDNPIHLHVTPDEAFELLDAGENLTADDFYVLNENTTVDGMDPKEWLSIMASD